MHVCIFDCQRGVLGVAPVHNAVLVYTYLCARMCGHWSKSQPCNWAGPGVSVLACDPVPEG